MPSLSKKFVYKDVLPIYKAMLEFVFLEHPDWIEKIYSPEAKKEVPAFFKHSYSFQGISYLSIGCNWPVDVKGGHIYEFYRRMRPKGKNGIYAWDDTTSNVSLTYFTLNGLFLFIEKNKIEKQVSDDDYTRFKSRLLYNLIPEFNHARKSSYSQLNKKILQQYANAPLNRPVPKGFIQSNWLCLERTDLGICISIIEFEEQEKTVFATLYTNYFDGVNNQKYSYKGIAYVDYGGDNIILNLFRNEEPGNLASFNIRLDKFNSVNMEMTIGHYTYYAIKFRRTVTKRVIWLRYTKDLKLPYVVCEIKRSESNQFKIINQHIRRFLYYKETNRLSQPEPLITRIASLQKWLKDYLSTSETDEVLHSMRSVNSYFLFFQYFDTNKLSSKPILKKVAMNFTKEGVGLPDKMCETLATMTFENVERKGRVFKEHTTLHINLSEAIDIKSNLYPHRFSTCIILQLLESMITQSISATFADSVLKGHMIGLANHQQPATYFKVCLVEKAKYDRQTNKIKTEVVRYLME